MTAARKVTSPASSKLPGTPTLNKLGSDGIYYEVSTAGDATSTLSGRYNAFSTGGTDSTAFVVGLNTSTSTAGQRSGIIKVDNLDVTTGGGTGRGGNDGDHILTVTLDVLDHADTSFSGESDLNLLSLDFGSVALGSTHSTFNFGVFCSRSGRLDGDADWRGGCHDGQCGLRPRRLIVPTSSFGNVALGLA